MKTTILLEDKMYKRLVQEAMQKHGSAKHLSTTINDILHRKFTPATSMFGKLKGIRIEGVRDEHDRSF